MPRCHRSLYENPDTRTYENIFVFPAHKLEFYCKAELMTFLHCSACQDKTTSFK